MAKTKNKISTKQRILDSAFSFYKRPCFTQISLSDIAKKTGISKAAIFKHFKNKEALLNAMQDQLLTVVARFINKAFQNLTEANWEKDISIYRIILKNAILCFYDNPEYLYYMHSLLTSSKNNQKELTEKFGQKIEELGTPLYLVENILGLSHTENSLRVFDIKRHASGIYCFVSIVLFISIALYGQPKNPISRDDLVNYLPNLLDFGFYAPEKTISLEKMAEIENIAKIDFSTIPELNPFFKAISELSSEYGLPAITIERLANKLGLAKSTLYSHSASKEEFIILPIEKEMANMILAITKVLKNFSNPNELAYAFMYGAAQYFLNRKELFITFQWIRMTGTFFPKKNPSELLDSLGIDYNTEEIIIVEKSPLKLERGTYFLWLCSLASTIVTQRETYNFTDEQGFEIIRYLFEYIQNGLTNVTNVENNIENKSGGLSI